MSILRGDPEFTVEAWQDLGFSYSPDSCYFIAPVPDKVALLLEKRQPKHS